MPRFLLSSLVLFSRIDAAVALDHPLRHAIVDRLRAAPGETVSELAQAFDVDYKTALHHVRILTRLGCMRLVPHGRRRHCFLPGTRALPPVAPRAVRALRAVDAGAAGPAALARAMGIPRGSAGTLLAGLERARLIEPDGMGGWRVAPAARETMALASGTEAT